MNRKKSPLRLDLLFMSGAVVNVSFASIKESKPTIKSIAHGAARETRSTQFLIWSLSAIFITCFVMLTILTWRDIAPLLGNQSEPLKPTTTSGVSISLKPTEAESLISISNESEAKNLTPQK